MTPSLSPRYERHRNLKGFGVEGQQKLKDSRVLVVGAGGLGSPVLYYLAAAGVGTLGICDGDVVEESNLNRQILHGVGTLGVTKVDSAADRLENLNPELNILRYPVRVLDHNVEKMLAGWDLVLDCTDNFDARFCISDGCQRNHMPLIEAGVNGWEGLVLPLFTREGPCYRCLFPSVPANVEKGPPVIGVAAGLTGAIMAQEAIRFLLGLPQQPGTLFRIDGFKGKTHRLQWPKRENCRGCNT